MSRRKGTQPTPDQYAIPFDGYAEAPEAGEEVPKEARRAAAIDQPPVKVQAVGVPDWRAVPPETVKAILAYGKATTTDWNLVKRLVEAGPAGLRRVQIEGEGDVPIANNTIKLIEHRHPDWFVSHRRGWHAITDAGLGAWAFYVAHLAS